MKSAKLEQYLTHIIPTTSKKFVGITFIQEQLEEPNATESPHKANNNPAMTQVQESPYGTWESPITPDHFASGSVILDQLDVNVRSNYIFFHSVISANEPSITMARYMLLRSGLPKREEVPSWNMLMEPPKKYSPANTMPYLKCMSTVEPHL